MNFVSHYYLDGLVDRPYHNFGLLLPDLMSIQKRGWKISEELFKSPETKEVEEIYAGFRKHLELDLIFHNSFFFVTYTNFIRDLLANKLSGLSRNRKHFLAHILLELVIDKVIISQDSGIVDRLYYDLDVIDDNHMRMTYVAGDEYVEPFIEFFHKFRTRRFLYNYVQEEAIVFVFNKILERVNIKPIEPGDDTNKLIEIIKKLEFKISSNFSEVKALRN